MTLPNKKQFVDRLIPTAFSHEPCSIINRNAPYSTARLSLREAITRHKTAKQQPRPCWRDIQNRKESRLPLELQLSRPNKLIRSREFNKIFRDVTIAIEGFKWF